MKSRKSVTSRLLCDLQTRRAIPKRPESPSAVATRWQRHADDKNQRKARKPRNSLGPFATCPTAMARVGTLAWRLAQRTLRRRLRDRRLAPGGVRASNLDDAVFAEGFDLGVVQAQQLAVDLGVVLAEQRRAHDVGR